MSGWASSRAIREALTPSPCGCQLEYEARKLKDPRDRAEKLERAAEYQCKWKCSKAGHTPHQTHDELHPESALALKQCEELIQHELQPQCPMIEIYRPWVSLAVDYWVAWEKSQLTQLYGDITSVELEALKLVAHATNARQSWEIKNPEKKDK